MTTQTNTNDEPIRSKDNAEAPKSAAMKALEHANSVADELGQVGRKKAQAKAAKLDKKKAEDLERALSKPAVSPEVSAAARELDALAHRTQNPMDRRKSEIDQEEYDQEQASLPA